MRELAIAILTITALSVSGSCGQAQTTAFAAKYFLDSPPTKAELAHLPPQARDVIVAKISIVKENWLGRRDQSGRPAPPSKNISSAQIKLLDILSGTAKSGDELDVFIRTAPDILRYITPATPAMKARKYFVIIFFDSDQERQLLGLPASQSEFERWEAELSNSSPGFHD